MTAKGITLFWRKPIRSLAEEHDAKVIDAMSLIQRLNRLMDGLPGMFYLKFMPGDITPRRVGLIDGSFVPTAKQFGYEPIPAPEPERTPQEKIIHGLQERQKRTIIFDFIDGDDGIITLRTKDGQRTTLTPEQIDVILKEAPITMFIAAVRWRQEEIDERDLDLMPSRDGPITAGDPREINPIFADIPFKETPDGQSYVYARDMELPTHIPYEVEPPETAAATFAPRPPPYDFQARTPLNLIREGREHEIGEAAEQPERLIAEEPAPGEPGGVPLAPGSDVEPI